MTTPEGACPSRNPVGLVVAPRRRVLRLAGLGAVGALLAACGTAAPQSRRVAPASAPGRAGTPATAPGRAAGDAPAHSWLYLTVLTGKMDSRKGYPEFVPADFSVPANTTVQAEIRCFDDGAAAVPSGYERVKGALGGTMTLIHGVSGELSGFKSEVVHGVGAKDVAHTLTIAGIALNIPIPPLSTVRFTFNSGAAGTYGWQCMSACGSGNSGWGGPMSAAGWMKGTMTVQA